MALQKSINYKHQCEKEASLQVVDRVTRFAVETRLGVVCATAGFTSSSSSRFRFVAEALLLAETEEK